MLPTLRHRLAERDTGLLWLLLFRWLAIALASVQSMLFDSVQLAQFSRYIGLLALYTLALTLLAFRAMPAERHILRSPWFVGGDVAGLLLLNFATGGLHSPLYRYSFAALTFLPYFFGNRGLWSSLALLIVWHAALAWLQTSPFTILLAMALDAIMLGALSRASGVWRKKTPRMMRASARLVTCTARPCSRCMALFWR